MESLSTMIEDIDFIDKYSVTFKHCVRNNIYTLAEFFDADISVESNSNKAKIEGVRGLLKYKYLGERNDIFDDVLFLNFKKMFTYSTESIFYNDSDNVKLCLRLGFTNEESRYIVRHSFGKTHLNIGEIIEDILSCSRRAIYIGKRKTDILYRKLNLLDKYYKELIKVPHDDVRSLELKIE